MQFKPQTQQKACCHPLLYHNYNRYFLRSSTVFEDGSLGKNHSKKGDDSTLPAPSVGAINETHSMAKTLQLRFQPYPAILAVL